MTHTKIVIVDDHIAFAQALAARVSVEQDLQVVGIAIDGREALETVRAAQPDVVTLDIKLGGENGIYVARRLLESDPRLRVVVVSCVEDPHVVSDAVRAGAVSWVAKDVPVEELLVVLRGVMAGRSWIPTHMLGVVLADLIAEQPPLDDAKQQLTRLSQREKEVLQLMVDGWNAPAIAESTLVSVNTVRAHIQNVLRKLGVHSRLEAVSLALQAGMRSRRHESIAD